MTQFRTLIVEDHKDYCRFLQLTLQEKTQCQVIGHASDGVEAVRQAEEFQPELILLDIGLPKLNGIEATRRIRKVAPNSKILIVSQNSSV
jgi:DNA-binding NarL/FixJ family response regulator